MTNEHTNRAAERIVSAKNIARVGTTTGRWPRYRFIVDGVDVGEIRRTVTGGGDRMSPTERVDGWRIRGTVCATRVGAEVILVERALTFGKL